MSDDNFVKFLMPDGTEVSNDPRFDIEEAREKWLESTVNTGTVGASPAEELAQTQIMHEETLNSTQPGVGPNAVPDDIMKAAHGPLGSPAQQVQTEDMEKAQQDGANPNSTSVEDPEPVDSNKAVMEVRETLAADREKYQEKLDKLGEDGPGDPEKPFAEWSAKQLQAEVARRNADESRTEEDRLDLTGMTKKSEVAELLDRDDARLAGGDQGQQS